MKKEVPICDKLNLTIEEAAAYTNIGRNRLEHMLSQPNCPFVLYVGNSKRLIKRKEFEKYNSSITQI